MADQRARLIQWERKPDYYDDFHCLMGECRIDCCCGWSVPMDKNDYSMLRSLRVGKELREKLDNEVHRLRKDDPNAPATTYAELTKLRTERCPLQREDGLCTLQLEAGEKALPKICRVFPRMHRSTTGGYQEWYLGLGCEGVLELLWRREPLRFVVTPYRTKGQKTFYRYEATPWLDHWEEIRAACICNCLLTRIVPLSKSTQSHVRPQTSPRRTPVNSVMFRIAFPSSPCFGTSIPLMLL